MSTFAAIRSNIADAINRTDLNTQIDLAINRAIEFYYNSEGFWFDETTGSFPTVIGQESYGTADGLPSDIVDISYMRLTISSTNRPKLDKRSYSYLQNENMSASTGTPRNYAWYQNKIYLSLVPNAVQTVILSYRKSYVEMTLDADTNNYTVYARDLIESRAKWWVYESILKDNEQADRAKAHELDALSGLRKRNAITTTGSTEPTDF